MPKKRILLVEDEHILQDAIRNKLEKSGYEVFAAARASEAEKIVSTEKIDFIWLDHYLLGEKSGFDFLVGLKKKGSGLEKIPVFVVSNTASMDKARKYIAMGAEKFYTKSNHDLAEIIGDMEEFI